MSVDYKLKPKVQTMFADTKSANNLQPLAFFIIYPLLHPNRTVINLAGIRINLNKNEKWNHSDRLHFGVVVWSIHSKNKKHKGLDC